MHALLPTALLLVAQTPDLVGSWRASLASPGGELPFGLELAREDGALVADIVNGTERIRVPAARIEGERGDELVLDIDHYDSRVRARIEPGGARLVGEWTKRSGADSTARMAFSATAGAAPRRGAAAAPRLGAADAPLAPERVAGRWRVAFASSDDPAVCELAAQPDGTLMGTFLTTTGDYRYLAGRFAGDTLRLSCFDGAHAFLFQARLRDDGSLAGDFWSRDSWHETWTAVRDADAALPDAFEQTTWRPEAAAAGGVFPDLEGQPRALFDPSFDGRARVIQVFGSWCPNCHDETQYLVELDRRYRARGLSILGLAFELTGEFERDAEQVRRFARRHGVEYPILIAGLADKQKATQAFPLLDRVRSYPTTIFLHGDGRLRAVHTGWTGPATGAAYDAVRAEFEALIEELLSEAEARDEDTRRWLAAGPWDEHGRGHSAEREWSFRFAGGDAGDAQVASASFTGSVDPVAGVATLAVVGNTVRLGDAAPLWIDRRAGVLYDPADFGRRLTPGGDDPARPASRAPLIAELRRAGRATLDEALRSEDPLVRREALVARAHGWRSESATNSAEWLTDADPSVRAAAAWACGFRLEANAARALTTCLADPNAAVRREAARALGRLGAGADELRALAGDPDPLVRAAARAALDEHGAGR